MLTMLEASKTVNITEIWSVHYNLGLQSGHTQSNSPILLGLFRLVLFRSRLRLFSSPMSSPPPDSPLMPVYSWQDQARDSISFVHHYLPLESSSIPPPAILPRRANPERRSNLVGVGHSWSANGFLLAELLLQQAISDSVHVDINIPTSASAASARKGTQEIGWQAYTGGMWDALMLVDPMIMDPESEYYDMMALKGSDGAVMLRMTMGRKDV